MGFDFEDDSSSFKAEPKYLVSNLRTSKRLLGCGVLSGEAIEVLVNECAKLKGINSILDVKMPIAMPSVDILDGKKYVFTNRKVDNEEQYIKAMEELSK